MRAKVSVWARGFAALAAAGVAVVFLGAGAASANATRDVHAVHVAVGQATSSAAAAPDETTWT